MLLKKGAQTIMWQSFHLVVVAADHIVVIDQGVGDGFFCRFDGGGEKRVHQVVRHDFNGTNRWLGVGGVRVGSREGDEQIAGAVAGNAAGAGETERSTAGQTFQLMREKRRVGRNDNDDGASFLFINGARNFLADLESTNR